MSNVKFSNSKWFLENNGEWIEIDENNYAFIKSRVWLGIHTYDNELEWQSTPDTEYQLPDDVEFEIKEHFLIEDEWNHIHRTDFEVEQIGNWKKVAHLKVEPTADVQMIVRDESWKDLKIEKKEQNKEVMRMNKLHYQQMINEDIEAVRASMINAFVKEHIIAALKQSVGLNYPDNENQEQSEVERLREENERLIKTIQSVDGDFNLANKQLHHLKFKIKQLESKLAERKRVFDELVELWNPIDEFIRNHPSIKLGDSVSKKALELLNQLPKEEEQG